MWFYEQVWRMSDWHTLCPTQILMAVIEQISIQPTFWVCDPRETSIFVVLVVHSPTPKPGTLSLKLEEILSPEILKFKPSQP